QVDTRGPPQPRSTRVGRSRRGTAYSRECIDQPPQGEEGVRPRGNSRGTRDVSFVHKGANAGGQHKRRPRRHIAAGCPRRSRLRPPTITQSLTGKPLYLKRK
ncbi:unnamed protein product, partial [Ixodes pacificus]